MGVTKLSGGTELSGPFLSDAFCKASVEMFATKAATGRTGNLL